MQTESLFARISLMIFGFALVGGGLELGWGAFGLGWGGMVFYPLIMLAGSLAGIACGGRYTFPSICGFVLGGVGALFAITLLLLGTDETHSFVVFVFAALGAAPGIGIYFLLKLIQNALFPNSHADVVDAEIVEHF